MYELSKQPFLVSTLITLLALPIYELPFLLSPAFLLRSHKTTKLQKVFS